MKQTPKSTAASIMLAGPLDAGGRAILKFIRSRWYKPGAPKPPKNIDKLKKSMEADELKLPQEEIDDNIISIYEATTGKGLRTQPGDDFGSRGLISMEEPKSEALRKLRAQAEKEYLEALERRQIRQGHKQRAQQTMDITPAERAMLMGADDITHIPVPTRKELTHQVEERLQQSIPREDVMDVVDKDELRALFEAIREPSGKK